MATLRFSWDRRKSASNLAKHGLSFDDAMRVWGDRSHEIEFDRFIDGEDRWHAIGEIKPNLLVVVVHSYPEGDDGHVRIISARRASSEERRRFTG